MGQFYANIVLHTDQVDAVARELKALKRDALVARRGDVTMVYDRRCDDQDIEELTRLARALSKRIACPVLASCNHDDDDLVLLLCEGGTVVDQYDSTPGYFEGEERDPVGGDASRLCAAFGAPDSANDVDALLRRSHRTVVIEGERHHAVAKALGVPPDLAMLGYRYATAGELPNVDDRRDVGTAPTTARSGGSTAGSAKALAAAVTDFTAASQGAGGSYWDVCALALNRASVPERFMPIVGVAEGNGTMLLDNAQAYVRSRKLSRPDGKVVADDLLAEFLGTREFNYEAMAKLLRAAVGIPPMTADEIAAYKGGDRQIMQRIAEGFLVERLGSTPPDGDSSEGE